MAHPALVIEMLAGYALPCPCCGGSKPGEAVVRQPEDRVATPRDLRAPDSRWSNAQPAAPACPTAVNPPVNPPAAPAACSNLPDELAAMLRQAEHEDEVLIFIVSPHLEPVAG
jgi:hypothetical protein